MKKAVKPELKPEIAPWSEYLDGLIGVILTGLLVWIIARAAP